MKIIKLLYFKYFLSFSICLISSSVIFFIFSLLGNLNEDYLFVKILKLSLLNSFQIIMYVPAFVFLISVVLFTNFLRSNNEIIIIKSYISIKKLMMFFLHIVLIFATLELNKDNFTSYLEISKTNLLKKDEKLNSKIIIDQDRSYKTYTVLENINQKDLKDAEYRSYEIYNDKIELAYFSSNLVISNNALIAKSYTKYHKNLIKNHDRQKKLRFDLYNLYQTSSIVTNLSESNNFKFNSVNFFIFFNFFFIYVFLVFFNKKYISTKSNLFYPISTSLIFIFYSFLIFNNSLSFYKQEFEIAATLIIFMLVLKEKFSE